MNNSERRFLSEVLGFVNYACVINSQLAAI